MLSRYLKSSKALLGTFLVVGLALSFNVHARPSKIERLAEKVEAVQMEFSAAEENLQRVKNNLRKAAQLFDQTERRLQEEIAQRDENKRRGEYEAYKQNIENIKLYKQEEKKAAKAVKALQGERLKAMGEVNELGRKLFKLNKKLTNQKAKEEKRLEKINKKIDKNEQRSQKKIQRAKEKQEKKDRKLRDKM